VKRQQFELDFKQHFWYSLSRRHGLAYQKNLRTILNNVVCDAWYEHVFYSSLPKKIVF